MEQRTLIISCVEYYSRAKAMPAPLAFQSFEQTDIIPMLLESQKQFPQMALDFYLGMIDGILTLGSQAAGGNFQADDARIAKIDEVVSLLAKKHKMDDPEACRMFYRSAAAKAMDTDAKLLKQPAEAIFAQIEAE